MQRSTDAGVSGHRHGGSVRQLDDESLTLANRREVRPDAGDGGEWHVAQRHVLVAGEIQAFVGEVVSDIGQGAQVIGVDVPQRHPDRYERSSGDALGADATAPSTFGGMRQDLGHRRRQRYGQGLRRWIRALARAVERVTEQIQEAIGAQFAD
jgi:hypothetical protein